MTEIPLAVLDPSDAKEIVGEQLLGFSLTSWLEAFEKLGPIFRVNFGEENHIVVCGHEADRETWRQADAWDYTDTESGTFFRSEMGPDHVTQLSGEAHRRSRKLILPAFGIKALQRDFPAMLDAMESAFANEAGSLDLFQVANFAYAKALANSQLKSGLEDTALKRLTEFEDWFIAGLRVPPHLQAAFHQTNEYLSLKSEATSMFKQVVAERLSGARPGDSLDLLLDKSTPGLEPLQESELVNATYLLSIAGIGNIANILVAAVWLLNQHPEWQERLTEELANQPLTNMSEGLANFPIMKAVVSEVERYYQPAPVIQKIAIRDVNILGTTIPKGENVYHLHGLSHYDPKYYTDPLKFDPSRWLNGTPEKPHVFGGGKHLCLGMGVARVLGPLSLGILIKHHHVTVSSPPISVTLAPHIESSPTTTSFEVTLGK